MLINEKEQCVNGVAAGGGGGVFSINSQSFSVKVTIFSLDLLQLQDPIFLRNPSPFHSSSLSAKTRTTVATMKVKFSYILRVSNKSILMYVCVL